MPRNDLPLLRPHRPSQDLRALKAQWARKVEQDLKALEETMGRLDLKACLEIQAGKEPQVLKDLQANPARKVPPVPSQARKAYLEMTGLLDPKD